MALLLYQHVTQVDHEIFQDYENIPLTFEVNIPHPDCEWLYLTRAVTMTDKC